MTHTYDSILEAASRLEPPLETGHLNVDWVVPTRLAIGRDADNRHLLVLAGKHIQTSRESIHKALMHGSWKMESGDSIDGTVLRLHAGEEFLVAATTIAAELLRRGLPQRPVADVFPEVEDFIELVIRRVLLPPEALLGLLGELLVLDALVEPLAGLPEQRRVEITAAWQGHSRKSRDFRINRLGLEVKTTSKPSSTHHVGGLDQIEPRVLDGEQVEVLRLVSIGLRADPTANSRFSIARLTDSILGRLAEEQKTKFLDQLRQYGPDDCMGYHHTTMSTWEPYARAFSITFPPRIYDLADENINVFRRSSLQQHFPHVLPEGLSFVIDLPDDVPGSHGANPKTDLKAELARLVQEFA